MFSTRSINQFHDEPLRVRCSFSVNALGLVPGGCLSEVSLATSKHTLEKGNRDFTEISPNPCNNAICW